MVCLLCCNNTKNSNGTDSTVNDEIALPATAASTHNHNIESLDTSTQDINIQEKIIIDIWSDVVCPFCFLGKKKIALAINKLNADDKVEIVWHSFQLDPDFDKNASLPSIQYLAERKGLQVDDINKMCDQLSKQATKYGIDFDFNKSLTFNTFDAHRLIHWAKKSGLSSELKEAFMLAHFSKGIDLSKKEKLLAAVKNVGLNVAEAQVVLNSNQFSEDVAADILKAKALGIRGVPYFLINNSEVISGAQKDKVFEKTIEAALKNIKPSTPAAKGTICTPDKICK